MDLTFTEMKNLIKSQKQPDKQFYLDLLDEEKQREYEDTRSQGGHDFAESGLYQSLEDQDQKRP